MLPAFHNLIGNFVILRFRKAAEHIAGGEQPLRRLRDFFFRHKSLLICFQKMQVGDAAVHIAACLQRHRRRFLRRFGHTVMLMKILNGPAVRHKMSLKAPFSSQNPPDQRIAAAAGLPVGPVIGAHDGLHLTFLHTGLKGGKVGLVHVLFPRDGIEFMAQPLRPGMHREMLGTGGRFQIFSLSIPGSSLQALHIGHAHAGGQIRVLSIGFMSPPPSGIPENIHIRGPEGEALVNIPVMMLCVFVVFGASFRRHRISDGAEQLLVKGGRHSDGLREAGCHTCPRHAVKRLVPPVISRNPQPGDRGRIVPKLGGLLLQRHL